MVKKVILLMAAMAFLAFSCTVTEVVVPNVTTLDAISLNPNTASTRAVIKDRDSLQNDPVGFVVYADTATTFTTTVWFIEGENHAYGTANGWSFTPAIAWPSKYPLAFLAFYPEAGAGHVITSVTDVLTPTSTSVELTIEIPTAKDGQEDVIVARDTAKTGKPSGGELPLNFKHILSKVNFTVSTDDPTDKAYVLAVGFCNLVSTATFEATDDSWTLGTYGTDIDTFNYYNAFEPIAGGFRPEIEFMNANKDSLFTGAAAKTEHLMLLPQDPDVWDISDPILHPTNLEAHIRLLYRLEVTGNPDRVGYADAQDHDDWSVFGASYTGPLYVMVGYAYDATWESGKGYSYDIPIPGTGGGIYLDEFYYDNEGNRTDLRIPGAVLYGHVLGDNISLPADVEDWIDEPSSDVFD